MRQAAAVAPRPDNSYRTAAFVAGAVLFTLALPGGAWAGGSFGWADFMSEWAAEGVAVGSVATTLIVLVAAFLIGYGAPSMIPVLVPMTLAGVIAANAESIAGTIGAGAAGGSVLEVVLPATGLG